ncbi:LysR family transcriptional regulator [Streptomyces sodiiphilus]|uniref:LysR family transcriptional regulator n=1 Tax=Streptomyces sodiiphilus TaxID=226217 RepID=A0ABN2PB72_9ACTN
MDLELRHLRTVRAIAEAGSLNKAAGLLGVAQPALSTQLRRIERVLGGPLFRRDRKGAHLTPLGELVLDRARVLLPAVQQLREEAVRFANREPGPRRLRIGGTHGTLPGTLVGRLAGEHAQSVVDLHTAWSVSELSGLVVEGRLDFVLAGVCGQSPPPAGDRLVWEVLGRDPVFVMLPENHPAAGRRELELGLLAGERWAGVPGDGCFADCFRAACSAAGFAPLTLYEADVAACVQLAQAGDAVGLCRATFPPTAGVAVRPLTGAPLSWRHLLGWHPGSHAAATAAGVLRHARASYAQAVARSAEYASWLPGHPGFGTAS